MNARRSAVAVLAVLVLTVGACGSQAPTSATSDTKRLEVVSWWTSGSEAAALGTLFTAFRRTSPGVELVNSAITGGAGSAAVVALAQRLQRNDPPDIWQTFAGASVQGYADRGVVRDVASAVAGSGWPSTMQPTILRSVTRDGKWFGVPTGAHRSNLLWFNRSLLAKAGVALPSSGYTVAGLLRDLEKIEASGVAPLCLGGKDPFTTVELFENVLLSTIGVNGWQDMVDDHLNWRGGAVRTALKSLGDLLRYTDPQASELTWDGATKKLATGGCAFESMNDSAYGELVADGARDGRDFGWSAFPGTQGSFLAVVDVFVAAARAKNAKNAFAFLGDITDPSTLLAFSKAKGSIPVVRGVDVSALPAYQQEASKSFWSAPVLLSVAHGEAMSVRFEEGFYNAVSTYVRTRDPDSFAKDLENAVSRDQVPPR